MRTREKIYVIIIGILFIILMISNIKCTGEKGNDKRDHTDYKTDTIISKEDYKKKYDSLLKTKRHSKLTPPKTVKIYQTKNIPGITIEKIPDSILLYIDSLETKLFISDKYIKNFPKNDKLLYMDINSDSLKISTLKIDGYIFEKTYPIYLDKYTYHWQDGELKHSDNKNKKNKAKNINKWNQLYFNPGYEYFVKKPKIGFDYSIILGRFKLNANTDFIINTDNNYLRGSINLGYRLF